MNPPPLIPDHQLLHPIGRGAYGEVWLARNVMGVRRAVKIVERSQFGDDGPFEREFRGMERYEPVSRSADGLVHVLHVGRNEPAGYFYYVMELADESPAPGANLDSRRSPDTALLPTESSEGAGATGVDPPPYHPRTVRSDLKRFGRLPTAECLRIALDLVGGLGRLHARGLVHRDVKPGNIIFVDGRAKLADIGLVSAGGEGGTFVGTEGYIPPEGPGSAAADLYALGMVLFEASTGFPPDRFPSVPPEWFADEADPTALEFHEIVLRACEGAKARRYASAEEMQADLALLQSGQSVRQLRALEHRARLWRRLGWAAGATAALALATSLVAHWQARTEAVRRAQESQLRTQALNSLARAETAEREAREQLSTALFEQARALVLSREMGHRTRALAALRRAAGTTNLAELRRVAFAALALPDLRPEGEIPFDPGVTLFQPDPTFSRVAMGKGSGPVTLHSLPDLQHQATLPASTRRDAYVASWSADGRFLAVKRQHAWDGTRSDLELWNVSRTNRIAIVGPAVVRDAFSFHPRRPSILVGVGDGRIAEWDLEEGKSLREWNLPEAPQALAYSPDGRLVAAAYLQGKAWVVALHEAESFRLLRTSPAPELIDRLSWHPQGRWICLGVPSTSPWSRGVHLLDPETGQRTTLGEHKIRNTTSQFTGDGQYLVTGGWDREIIWWDLEHLQRVFTYAGTGYRHFWSADARHCGVVLPDHRWQRFAFDPPLDRVLSGTPGGELRYGCFSPDGRWLVTRDEQHLGVWEVNRRAPATLVPAPPGTRVFFSPDSRELFSATEGFSDHPELHRWRLQPRESDASGPSLEPLPIRAPADLTRASLASNELVLSTKSGVQWLPLSQVAGGVGRAVRMPAGLAHVSPGARWLAMVYDYSPDIGIYRLPAAERVTTLSTSNLVMFVTFSPAGDELLVINRSGIEWFDTTTWKPTRRQRGTPVSGSYAFYTPAGDGIWIVTHFRNAALYDRRSLEPILPLPNDVLPIALDPEGRRLAVSVEGRRVHLWDLPELRAQLGNLGLDWSANLPTPAAK